jgi:hypothetical protein
MVDQPDSLRFPNFVERTYVCNTHQVHRENFRPVVTIANLLYLYLQEESNERQVGTIARFQDRRAEFEQPS